MIVCCFVLQQLRSFANGLSFSFMSTIVAFKQTNSLVQGVTVRRPFDYLSLPFGSVLPLCFSNTTMQIKCGLLLQILVDACHVAPLLKVSFQKCSKNGKTVLRERQL